MNGKTYARYAKARAAKSPLLKDCVRAYLIGGLICAAGEGLRQLWQSAGLSEDNAGAMTSVCLIFLTALLTGLGVFDKIAKHGGGGTLVPITGFANAVSSAAIDGRSEGFIMGVGTKIFAVAGPVILYGTAAGTLYGVLYWLSIVLS